MSYPDFSDDISELRRGARAFEYAVQRIDATTKNLQGQINFSAEQTSNIANNLVKIITDVSNKCDYLINKIRKLESDEHGLKTSDMLSKRVAEIEHRLGMRYQVYTKAIYGLKEEPP